MRTFLASISLFLLSISFGPAAMASRQGDPDPSFAGGAPYKTTLTGSNGKLLGFAHNSSDTYSAVFATTSGQGNYFSTLLRLNHDGTLDVTLNSIGVKQLFSGTYNFVAAAFDSSNGNVVMLVTPQIFSSNDVEICRYNSNGVVDNNLIGHNGIGCISISATAIGGSTATVLDASSIAVQPADHKIIFAGTIVRVSGMTVTRSLFVTRLNATGTIDTTFNGSEGSFVYGFALNGSTDTEGRAVALDASNRIVVAGSTTENSNGDNSDFAALRLTSAGLLDSTCGTTNIPCKITYDFGLSGNDEDGVNSIAFDSDGSIYLSGQVEAAQSASSQAQFANGAIKLSDKFVRDTTFAGSGAFSQFSDAHDLSAETDVAPGSIVDAQHRLMLIGGSSYHVVAIRLLANGAVDPAFENGSSPYPGHVAVTRIPNIGTGAYPLSQPVILLDGELPVIAAFTRVEGNPGAIQLLIARLLGNDTIFYDAFDH